MDSLSEIKIWKNKQNRFALSLHFYPNFEAYTALAASDMFSEVLLHIFCGF